MEKDKAEWEALRGGGVHGAVSVGKLSEEQKEQGRTCRQNRKRHKEREREEGSPPPNTHVLSDKAAMMGGGAEGEGRLRQMRVMAA